MAFNNGTFPLGVNKPSLKVCHSTLESTIKQLTIHGVILCVCFFFFILAINTQTNVPFDDCPYNFPIYTSLIKKDEKLN